MRNEKVPEITLEARTTLSLFGQHNIKMKTQSPQCFFPPELFSNFDAKFMHEILQRDLSDNARGKGMWGGGRVPKNPIIHSFVLLVRPVVNYDHFTQVL